MTFRPKVPTYTSLVYDKLRELDDFVTAHELRDLLRLDSHSVTNSLAMLRKFGAVESLESGGVLWWYATPENDKRQRVFVERRPESKPRRVRRVKKT